MDVCWEHSTNNVTGEEYCTAGTGVLVFEEIAVFLCPDAALEGILETVVDTTNANIPYTRSSFATLAEPSTTSNTTENWMRLYGQSSQSGVTWAKWEFSERNGTRCRERANHGWSTAALGAMTLREAVEVCAANYPDNCGGIRC